MVPFAFRATDGETQNKMQFRGKASLDWEKRLMIRQAILVVFSHLRWDFGFQQPQHLLTRMARKRHMIFIEEPILDSMHQAYLELTYIDENLLLVRPHSPIDSPGFSEEQMPILKKLLCEFFAEQGLSKCVAWFYTPLALPLLTELPHDLVVYDCMDALDTSLNAPPLLKEREQELLDKANFVFTGGPSLFKRLGGRRLRVHCLPSSVEDEQVMYQGVIGDSVTDMAQKHEVLAFANWDSATNALLNLIERAIADRSHVSVASKTWTKLWRLKKNIVL